MQLQGKKEWIMVDPEESDLLYPVKSRFGNHVTKFGHQKANQDKFPPSRQAADCCRG